MNTRQSKKLEKRGRYEIILENVSYPNNLVLDVETKQWYVRQGAVRRSYDGTITMEVENSSPEENRIPSGEYTFRTKPRYRKDNSPKWGQGNQTVTHPVGQGLDELLANSLQDALNKQLSEEIRKKINPTELINKILA